MPGQGGRPRARARSRTALGGDAYRRVVDSIRDTAIYLIDPHGTILTWNSGAEAITGYTLEEVVGTNYSLQFTPADRAARVPQANLRRCAATGFIETDGWRLRKDGSRFWASVVMTAMRDSKGSLTGFTRVVRDASDRRAADEALRVEHETAELASKAKTDFLARMSHELRTPLNSVIGFAELLAMDELSDDHRQSVEMIRAAGDHLLGLINEVLEISRIEAGAVDISLETVSVPEAVSDAIGLVHAEAVARNITINTNASDERGPSIRADRRRVRQVLINLLSNAVKYSWPNGTVDLAVTPRSDGRVTIAVSNRGLGIRAEDMSRLFQPFERLRAPAFGVEGTGLGLTLTKHLLDAMAGTITVESGEDGVTTFAVSLPRARSVARMRQPAVGRRGVRTARAATATVLHVEDTLSNLELVEQILARRPGIKLVAADRGELALALARSHRPDLILLDLHLPDIDGTELLRRLRADERTAAIPVVVVTADVTPATIAVVRDAGVQAYLTKPLRVTHFLSVVDALLRDAALHGGHARAAAPATAERDSGDAAGPPRSH